jgi:hypothetical protein
MRTPEARRVSISGAMPVFELFEHSPALASYRALMEASQDQLPLVADFRQHGPDAISLPAAEYALAIERAWSWTFDMRVAGFVIGVALDLVLREGCALESAVHALFDDLDTDRQSRTIDGELLPTLHPDPQSVARLGFDFHGIVIALDPADNGMTRTQVQPLVSRRWHLSRPTFVTASITGTDELPDGVVAVTPGATFLSGVADDTVLAVIICAAQSVVALALLRHLQDEAFRAAESARRLDGAPAADHAVATSRKLEISGRTLAALELDLSLGVERFGEMRIFLPVWRVEQYHKALGHALGVERATAVTATMLERVATAVGEARATLESQRWRRADNRRRWFSATGSAVAFVGVVLSLVLSFLSISPSPVGSGGSALRGGLIAYYVGLLTILVLAAGAGAVLARATNPDRHRPGPADE